MDGDAGQNTCRRLYVVHTSEYFTDYGRPLTDSQWGQKNILEGKIGNVDLLARIIFAEGADRNDNDKKGVALVIKNRVDSPDKNNYQAPEGASVYARVIGCADQYTTAKAGNKKAQCPQRGADSDAAQGYVNPGWKMAVELAKNIVNGNQISTTGYKVNGAVIESATMPVNSTNNKQYLNQMAWGSFQSEYAKENVDTAVQPLTFSREGEGCNVIFKWKEK